MCIFPKICIKLTYILLEKVNCFDLWRSFLKLDFIFSFICLLIHFLIHLLTITSSKTILFVNNINYQWILHAEILWVTNIGFYHGQKCMKRMSHESVSFCKGLMTSHSSFLAQAHWCDRCPGWSHPCLHRRVASTTTWSIHRCPVKPGNWASTSFIVHHKRPSRTIQKLPFLHGACIASLCVQYVWICWKIPWPPRSVCIGSVKSAS